MFYNLRVRSETSVLKSKNILSFHHLLNCPLLTLNMNQKHINYQSTIKLEAKYVKSD